MRGNVLLLYYVFIPWQKQRQLNIFTSSALAHRKLQLVGLVQSFCGLKLHCLRMASTTCPGKTAPTATPGYLGQANFNLYPQLRNTVTVYRVVSYGGLICTLLKALVVWKHQKQSVCASGTLRNCTLHQTNTLSACRQSISRNQLHLLERHSQSENQQNQYS